MEGKEVGEKEQMYKWERNSQKFSQWDVETDACMLKHCVCIIRISGDKVSEVLTALQ